MIKDLDISFKNMLVGEAPPSSELSKAAISFTVPNDKWRNTSSGLSLNIYLYRILEDRELRQNDRHVVRNADGTVSEQQFPVRIECGYLMTAWNFSQQTGGEEPEKQEHRLLSQVLLVLFRNPTLPSKYLSGLLVTPQQIDPPIISARSDDLGAADSDFWSGLNTPLRPSVTCKITFAMDLGQAVTGPMVTSAITGYSGGDELIAIGGIVRDASGTPIPNAWVVLDARRTLVITDADGKFLIDSVSRGAHTLTVRAAGFQQATRAVAVPSPSGEYDVILT